MKIHFIGIGGIGMSGLAAISLELGDVVSGSDNQTNSNIDLLKKNGATIFQGHNESNLSETTELVVYSAAVPKDNPERVKANNLGIPTMNRAEFLGALMKRYADGIAISGTHGKTSTTSMLSTIFVHAKKDPTISIGGNLPYIGGNYRVGKSDAFITEACEYVDSFSFLYPKYAIILNIEWEHIDYFKNLEQVIKSFRNFASHVPKDGKIIANGDDQNIRAALKNFENVIYFGFSDQNDFVIQNIPSNDEKNHFSIKSKESSLGNFAIQPIGAFNQINAAASILCAYFASLDVEEIRSGIEMYSGVDRRFQKKGSYNGASVYDDYAHHPTEVQSTLLAASNVKKNRLITIFQPHTFSRTHSLMDEFAESFSSTDILVLADIYPSREKDTGLVHSKDLFQKLQGKVKELHYFGSNEEILAYLQNEIQPNDLVLTMGAGNINEIANQLVGK